MITRADLWVLQSSQLSAGMEGVLRQNPFYQRKFQAAGWSLTRFQEWERHPFQEWPYTTKEELLADQEAHPPYGSNLTFSPADYVRLHQTSGSSGRRLRWLDTSASWQWILDCWDFIFRAVELTPTDRLFFPFSFGPFLGFWAAFEGAARRGYFVLAGGGLSTTARLQLLWENQISCIFCTPTYALRLADCAQAEGLNLMDSTVHTLVLAGEPGAQIPAVRQRLESAFAARVFDHSGMTEIGSLGIEGREQPGKLFLLENQAIAEFLHPQTLAPVPAGEIGELVLTNLGRWGSPLIRYRTGDLVRWDVGPRLLGMPFVHLVGGILGRVDDMLWIKGNNVYPSSIEAVVREFPEVMEFQIQVRDLNTATALTLVIEPHPSSQHDETLPTRLAQRIHDRLFFHPNVQTVAPQTLPRFEMKARRVQRLSVTPPSGA